MRRTTFSETANGSAPSRRSMAWMVRPPPHSPALLEQDSDPFAQAGVLVPGLDHRALVVVGAAGQTHGPQNGVEAELIPERVNDPRPLPVRQFGGIVARAVDF